MKRTQYSRTLKQTFLAVPAAALMLGVSSAQTTIGINFAGGAYAAEYGTSYTANGITYNFTGPAYFCGFPVTAKAFGVAPADWSTSTNGTNPNCFPYNYSANGTMVVGPASSLTVNWSSPDCWGTRIGYDVYDVGITNGAGNWAPPPGNDEVTWGFLDNGAWSVSLSGLNATFPNGYVVQMIAASGDTGPKVNSSSHVTDGASFTNAFQIYSVDSGFGLVGLTAMTPTLTSDTITLSPSGACSLSGFIVTDKPVISWDPQSVTNSQGSQLVLTAGAIGIPPLSYQWEFNGVPIAGATNSAYTNANTMPADAGDYTVLVTNTYGSATSGVATVAINQIVLITDNLPAVTNVVYAGVYTLLSVGVTGPSLSYQWDLNGAPITGGTNEVLTVSNLTTGLFAYSLTVTNPYSATNSATTYLNVTASPDTYTAKIGIDEPDAYWPLNETSGTNAYDYSGHGNNGAVNGGVTLAVTGPQPPTFPGFAAGKTAYQFDGSSGYIYCNTNASITGTNDFSVEAWIQTTATSEGSIIQQRGNQGGGYQGEYQCLVTAGGAVNFYIYNNGYQFDLTSSRVVNDGNWHHIVGVRQGVTGTIYIDGNVAATAAGTSVLAMDPTIETYIGADGRTTASSFFSGSIANAAVYNHALSAGDVISHYVTASGIPQTIQMVTGGIILDSKPAGTLDNGLNYGTTWLASSADLNSVTRNGVEQFNETNNSQIAIPYDPNLNTTNGTICFWISYNEPLVTGLPGSGTEAAILFDDRTTQGAVVGVNGATGTVEFQGNGGGPRFTNSDYVVDGDWHHVAITYDQGTNGVVSVYVDGNLDTSLANSTNWSWPTNVPVELGRSRDTYWKIYNGQMDDFRMYNRILQPSEISQIVNGDNSSLVATGLLVRYNFNSDPALSGKSLTWTYGTLQSSPALGAGAVWTSLTNVFSPQPILLNPATPATFYRTVFAP